MFFSLNKDTNVIFKNPYISILINEKKKKSFPVEIHFVALAKATRLSN